jgi:arsenite methyltransferase
MRKHEDLVDTETNRGDRRQYGGNEDEVRAHVRATYGEIARTSGSCCAPGSCAPAGSARLGYAPGDLASAPEGADLGLGCGSPQELAAIREGETVLDLGSGAGLDCFLASRAVGASGRVIGVDMTPDMITKARANAAKAAATNVEFRLGEIERLPVADRTVDVVISNCVLNLSPSKKAVLEEAFRVLRPGGRLAIADVVAIADLPAEVRDDLAAHGGCVAGAATAEALRGWLAEVGFEDVRIRSRADSREIVGGWLPDRKAEHYIESATIEATKPGGARACCGPSCCVPEGAA